MSVTDPSQPPEGYTVPAYAYGPSAEPPALGGAGERLLAYVIDNLIITFGALVIVLGPFIAAMSTGWLEEGEPPPPGFGFLMLACVLVAFAGVLAYETVPVVRGGATVGKRAVKLRVVRADDGGPVGYGRALGRAAIVFAFKLFGCVFYLDALWLLWDKPNRQTLHDKVAGTIVVRTDPQPWSERAVLTHPMG